MSKVAQGKGVTTPDDETVATTRGVLDDDPWIYSAHTGSQHLCDEERSRPESSGVR